MARKPALRVASAGDAPKRVTPKSISEALAADSSREVYVAMRSRIARALDDPTTPGRDLAALSRRLHELQREIEAMDATAVQEAQEARDVDDATWEAV